jgi:FSR family fosmidomycin resistance protein-like MFS transporter
LGDRFGIQSFGCFGTALLPYANLFWTGILSVIIGMSHCSAFSAILVFAQDDWCKGVGMISGFFGFLLEWEVGSAILGYLADQTSIEYVYKISSLLSFGVLLIFVK